MKAFENPTIIVEEFEVVDIITKSSSDSVKDPWDTGKESIENLV